MRTVLNMLLVLFAITPYSQKLELPTNPGAVHWAPNNTQLLPTSRAQSSLSPCRRQEKVNMTFWERRERNLAKDFLE